MQDMSFVSIELEALHINDVEAVQSKAGKNVLAQAHSCNHDSSTLA